MLEMKRNNHLWLQREKTAQDEWQRKQKENKEKRTNQELKEVMSRFALIWVNNNLMIWIFRTNIECDSIGMGSAKIQRSPKEKRKRI